MEFIWKIFILLSINKMYTVTPQYSVRECSNEDQELAHSLAWKASCDLRYVTVDLDVSNHTGAVQVIPSQTVVKRCGGSCWSSSHTCHPKHSKMTAVDAIIVSTSWGEGRWSTSCFTFYIREDTECECGCRVRQSDCSPLQYYKTDSCQCICTDWDLRNQCVQMKDKYWDSRNCACLCRPETWKTCSTGYMFDSQDSCQCVATFMLASTSVIMVVTVALFSSVGLLVLLIISRRAITASKERRISLARVLEDEDL